MVVYKAKLFCRCFAIRALLVTWFCLVSPTKHYFNTSTSFFFCLLSIGRGPSFIARVLNFTLFYQITHSTLFLQPDYDDQEEQNVIKVFPTSRNNKEKSKDGKKYGMQRIDSIINLFFFFLTIFYR